MDVQGIITDQCQQIVYISISYGSKHDRLIAYGRTSLLSPTSATITHTSFSYTAQTMIPPNSNPLTCSTPTQVASSSTTPPLLLAQANICIKTNRTFRERRDEVEQLQKRCTAASLEKGVVDGWSDEVKRGVNGWVDDIEVSWRCLRVSFGRSYAPDLRGNRSRADHKHLHVGDRR
jgi:hypothetical protein